MAETVMNSPRTNESGEMGDAVAPPSNQDGGGFGGQG